MPHAQLVMTQYCLIPQADLDTLMGMLEVGREVLASAVDENRRRWI